ncbi:MAG: type II toxin-antitoxin system death-on-curing family toxin [[Lactobacillus] timonensis]|jgi:death-on-curing protein|nr:type II toxin-antitoxin system death-on-curing family toxin [[Lactobacillus] timonensis]
MIYLTKADIIAVNHYVLEGVGQTYRGIQYPEGLSLVIEQPQMVVFGHPLYPKIWLKAAYIMQKITKKHIFADGNKRTSFLTTLLFLKKNSYNTSLTVDEGEALIMQITLANDTEDEMVKVSEFFSSTAQKIIEGA